MVCIIVGMVIGFVVGLYIFRNKKKEKSAALEQEMTGVVVANKKKEPQGSSSPGRGSTNGKATDDYHSPRSE